jgi:hypothetical protein
LPKNALHSVKVFNLLHFLSKMKKLISARFSAFSTVFLLSIFVVFHILVMLKLVPSNIVWGGRLNTPAEMMRMETISVTINLIMIAFAAVRAGILKFRINPNILQVAFWLLFVLFTLNTLGNILSLNTFEKYAFTPVTFLLAIFCLRLAIDKK